MPLRQRYSAAVIDAITGKATFPVIANLYVSLHTAAPTVSTDGTEVSTSGTDYARVRTAAANWDAATQGAPSFGRNTTAVTFPTARTSWGDIIAFAVWDAASGGNMIGWGTATTQTISAGVTPYYPVGSLQITGA